MLVENNKNFSAEIPPSLSPTPILLTRFKMLVKVSQKTLYYQSSWESGVISFRFSHIICLRLTPFILPNFLFENWMWLSSMVFTVERVKSLLSVIWWLNRKKVKANIIAKIKQFPYFSQSKLYQQVTVLNPVRRDFLVTIALS